MTRIACTLAAALVALSLPHEALAWSCDELGCPVWDAPISLEVYALSADLEAIAAGRTLSTIEDAASDWANVMCADVPAISVISATEAGPSTLGDGRTTIAFLDEDWPGGAELLGVTDVVVRGGLPGALIEADIQMNARDYRWVEVRGATPFIHARSIVGHELGHLLGLGHTQEADAVMFATYDRGYLVIAPDDEEGICALYPRDGAPVACTGGDCPFGRVCDEGVCVPAPMESCVDTMDCAHDEVCFAPLGECIETVLPTDDLGEACTEDEDCQSGRCHDFGEGRVCTSGCDGFNTASCPRGFFCDGRALDQCDIGFCRAGERGEGSLGSECGEDAACASLYCDSGRCAVPCDVTSMSSTECPGGFTCQPGERGCGACLAPRETGAACTSDLECAGAICLMDADGGEGICTQRCNDSSPCPDGLRCDDGTADPVCIQPASGCSGCQGGGSGPGGGFLAHFATFAAFLCIFAAFRRRTRLL